jgi:hypothetical protein
MVRESPFWVRICQRAVQLRILKMDAKPDWHFRPTVFICDEHQNFATVGGDNPTAEPGV